MERILKTRTIPVISDTGQVFTVIEYTKLRRRSPGYVPGEHRYTLKETGEPVTVIDPDMDLFEAPATGLRLHPR